MDLKEVIVDLRKKENKTEQDVQMLTWLEELLMRRELMNIMEKDFKNYKDACAIFQKQ